MTDERPERLRVVIPLGSGWSVGPGAVRPFRRCSIDGPGWAEQVRARAQDRAYRATHGLDVVRRSEPATRTGGASLRLLGDAAPGCPRSGRSLRSASRRRMLRAALLCLGVAAFVLGGAFLSTETLVKGLLALGVALGVTALIYDVAEGQGRTDA